MARHGQKGKPVPPTPEPSPPPPSPPVPPSPPPADYEIKAKFELGTVEDQSVVHDGDGSIAIDFSVSPYRLRFLASRSVYQVWDYEIPAPATWNPAVTVALPRTAVNAAWWDYGSEGSNSIYGAGFCRWNNDWWIISRMEYNPFPPTTTTIWPESDPTEGAITFNLPRQAFSGFVKGLPGTTPQIGCGGYNSGQGSTAGPTVADMDGTVHLLYGFGSLDFSDTTGTPTGTGRAPREPNYTTATEWWGAISPQGDPLVGRWGVDRVYGGGVKVGSEIWFFPWQGTGEFEYTVQNNLLTRPGVWFSQAMRYKYNASTYALIGYDYLLGTDRRCVYGQEQDSSGRVYLSLNPDPGGAATNVQVWVYGPV